MLRQTLLLCFLTTVNPSPSHLKIPGEVPSLTHLLYHHFISFGYLLRLVFQISFLAKDCHSQRVELDLQDLHRQIHATSHKGVYPTDTT